MPRNMSFFYTQQQIRDGSKTVTRRIGWDFLKPGDVLNACVKCQGLGKGGKIELIRQIRVTGRRKERLRDMYKLGCMYGDLDARKEGFPELTGRAFVEMFCRHMKCKPDQIVNRIEFEYA